MLCVLMILKVSIEWNQSPSLDAQGGLDYSYSVVTKVVKENTEDVY